VPKVWCRRIFCYLLIKYFSQELKIGVGSIIYLNVKKKGCIKMPVIKLLKISGIYILILFLIGANWPENLPVKIGADLEKTRDLRYQVPNMVGTDVVELQERLKELGFYLGEINGIYDQKVAQAVKEFQKDNGLAVDGIVRDHIWIRLADNYLPVNKNKKITPPQGEVRIVVDTFKLRLIVLNDNEPLKFFLLL